MNILKSLIEGVTGPVATYVTRRMELKAQEHQNKLEYLKAQGDRSAKLISEGLACDATWELESLRAHSAGWKDELVLLVLTTPLVLCFIPGTAPYVLQGFNILAQTPDWFRWLVFIIFSAIYGIRIWRRQQSDT
jgi:hypothetical protein